MKDSPDNYWELQRIFTQNRAPDEFVAVEEPEEERPESESKKFSKTICFSILVGLGLFMVVGAIIVAASLLANALTKP